MKAGLLALLVLGVGCGEPLVGPQFLGTPLLEVGGVIVLKNSERGPEDHGPVRLSLFWIGASGAQEEQGAELDSGLARYSMTLFDPPSLETQRFGDLLTEGGSLGLALIALYADRDEDDQLDLEIDLLLGASDRHLVVWSEIAVPEGSPAAPLLGPIGAGYHLFQYDRESQCRFVAAAACQGVGGLLEVPQDSAVPLTLWDDPEQVLVPSPHFEPSVSSLWGR